MIPYAPDRQLYVPSTRAQDIILRQGEAAEDSAARSGQIWGNALQDLGGIASGYVQDRAAQKEEQRRTDAMNKRENALFNLIGDGSKLPDYREVRKVVGPEKADETYNTITSYFKLKNQPNTAKPEDVQRIGRWWLKASPEAKAQSYPALRSAISPLFPGVPIPEQLTPETEPQVEQFINSLTPPEKVGTKTVEVLNPDGSKTTKIVEDKPGQEFTSAAPPAKPKDLSVEEADMESFAKSLGKSSAADLSWGERQAFRARRAAAGREPDKPSLKTIITTDENGRSVTQLVKIGPNGETADVVQTFTKPLSAVEQRQTDANIALVQTGNTLMQTLTDPNFTSKIGPLAGRYNNLKEFLGNPPKEFANLAGRIDGFSKAAVASHNMRSAEAAKELDKKLSQKLTPEALSGLIEGMLEYPSNMVEVVTGKKLKIGPEKSSSKKSNDPLGIR